MDSDVIATTLAISGLALIAGVLGYRFSFTLSPSPRILLFGAVMLLVSLYAAFVVGRLEVTTIMPSGIAIFATNVTPVLIAFGGGLAWTLPTLNYRSRWFRFSSMAILSVVFYFAPLIRPLVRPVVSDEMARFDDGICLQSHPATCGAAAAATLLYQHGIKVSEQDMIQACLTSSDGTEPLGLYRGLKSQTKLSRVTPRLASGDVTRWSTLQQFPLVAFVSFTDDTYSPNGSGHLKRILGRDADGHAIVVLGLTKAGNYIIGDPAVGRTIWDAELLERRFSGQAIYLAHQHRQR